MNDSLLSVDVEGHELLLGDRFLRIENTVVISDVHLGKTMHFRKAGLPIPATAREADQRALLKLLNSQKPDRLIVLGDLFHSVHNSEAEELAMITSQFTSVEFTLVMGNHDVMAASHYRSIDFETCHALELGPFTLSHEPLQDAELNKVNLHGHLHPGVLLRGKGRQSVVVPCFHFQKTHCCMPAFGALTGLMKVKPKRTDRVFGVIDKQVVGLL